MSGKKIAEFLGWTVLCIFYFLILMGIMVLMEGGGGFETTLIPSFNSGMPLD